jgi:hypothetical protein
MPFDSSPHPELIEDLSATQGTLYALPGYNGATILHSRPDCNTMSHVATVFRSMAEGEVWKDGCYGPSYRVTWAREAAVA